MLLDLVEPFLQVDKSLVPSHIISQKHDVGTPVENASHRLIRLLSCSVPYLHLHNFVVNSNAVATELHPDGHLVLSLELIVHHPLHQTRLTNPSVTDDDQLEHMVMVLLQNSVGDVLALHLCKSRCDLGLLYHIKLIEN